MAKLFIGTVVSDKSDKTITVNVVTRKTHPIYKKQYMQSSKFMAHDENNEANEGDTVSIMETKPLSARKRFVLNKVVEKAAIRHIEEEKTLEDVLPEEAVKKEVPKPVSKRAPKNEVEKK